jgi:nitroreductase
MRDSFKKAIEFRHACKIFDENQKISQDDLMYILECTRLAPSSFGMEPWKFLIISNQELKVRLQPYCWNQPQITTCSHLVVILAAIDSVKPSSNIPQQKFAKRDLPQEKIDGYIRLYSDFLAPTFSDDDATFCWTSKQTYIALSHMMNAAATIGIDSCAIEGFERENVERVLQVDTTQYRVSVMLPLGYRLNPQLEHIREDFDTLFEFIE